MKNNSLILLILLSIVFSFSACNAVKYVPEEAEMLTKNTVFVNGKKNVDNEVTDYVVQRPNQLVLGIPVPLHFYNLGNKEFVADFEAWKIDKPGISKFTTDVFSEKQARGLRKFKASMHNWFLQNGEAPVLLDQKKTAQTVDNLSLNYFYKGFFNVQVRAEKVDLKKKRVGINYFIETGKPYTLDSLNRQIDSKVLDSIYETAMEQSHIKPGSPFDYALFEEEKNRLARLFRNSGIFRFNRNTITFEADSALNNHQGRATLIISDSISNSQYRIQKINSVRVFTDFTFNTKDEPIRDSLNYRGYQFLAQTEQKYNPKLLLNSIFVKPGDIYKDEMRELTRRHLRALNNFRSVDIKYSEDENGNLDAAIRLTPLKKYSIGINTELTHSNIRQLGISGKLSFSNRNIFKGAEILKFSVQGSFLDSKDAAENDKLLNAWEVGGDVSLELPRFLLPFKTEGIVPNSMFPRTTITLGTSLQENIGLDKQKFTGIIDYTWESSRTMDHKFELINTQFIKNLNVDSYFNIYKSEFRDINTVANEHFNQDLNPTEVIAFIDREIDAIFEQSNPEEFNLAQNIKNRYQIITEDVLVPASSYTFTYNNSENYKDTDFSFFRARFVSSGNLATLLSSKKDENGNRTMLGTPIAQYIRTDLEYKKFWNLSLENVLAFRGFLGIAIPYGNSSTIPFSRSYFIGGPNDLRAWGIYDLGPGSSKSGLEYNVGNLKFISSLEYRFKIINSIKGALFVDAGNIWDISNSNVTTSEAKFSGLNSIKDIAIGSGFGLRYDLSFILLRLDLGFKTYEPYLPAGSQWFKNYNFKNTVYNFGISYPF